MNKRMFYGYIFYGLFTLFFIRIQCRRNREEENFEFITTPEPSPKMDDLKNFNMSYYCKFQASTRTCEEKRTSQKYFFDVKLKECFPFEYGFCAHSYNMFNGRHICLDSCRDEVNARVSENVTFNVFCRYQPDFGDCNSYHPKYYYDVSEGTCKGFAYSGCGGNQNRFASAIRCLDVCGIMYMHHY